MELLFVNYEKYQLLSYFSHLAMFIYYLFD